MGGQHAAYAGGQKRGNPGQAAMPMQLTLGCDA